MDGRGGCCIARYGYGGDVSMVDKIMLRFRPIAPRPVDGGGSPPENSDVYVKRGRGRGKRCSAKQQCKNNKNNNNTSCKRKRPSPPKTEEKTVVTLPLLPETPASSAAAEAESQKSSARWLSFENTDGSFTTSRQSKAAPVTVTAVGKSCVTVECVTDTWVDGDGLGRTDEERRVNLEGDTCPGFVSDGDGRVVWTNGAYRSMVGVPKEGEVMVWLVMKERAAVAVGLMSSYTAAFTCRVRVQYSGCTSGNGGVAARDWSSLTLPCDVWRMEGGGFAWRLDVKAALCLGRYGRS